MPAFPKTVAQFRRQAEAGFLRANPDAGAGLEIAWTFGPQRAVFPTGLSGFSGVFTASAPGFATKTCVASATRETGLSVR